MIVLFTDYGADDIYVAQVKVALLEHLLGGEVIVDLAHSVPNFHPRAGAHLLAALQARFPAGAVFVAVVDPGVGTDRDAVIVRADDKWYVGPDNGLLSVVAARAASSGIWRIRWRPQALSASFQGRDLFAPIAAAIARGAPPADKVEPTAQLQVKLGADDLPEVIYVDHYGNVLTGLRVQGIPRHARIGVKGRSLPYARVFADAPKGSVFWYENSIGLVELAANQAGAAELLDARPGDPVSVME